MADYVSEECKRSVKNVEDRLYWAHRALKDFVYSDVAFPNMISYLASSFNHFGATLDDDCKDFFRRCEEKLLLVSGKPTTEKIASIDQLLSQLKEYAGER